MKNELNFWLSFELYVRKFVGRSPIPFTFIVISIAALVLITSVFNVKNSVVDLDSISKVVIKSADLGDYKLAELLFQKLQGRSTNEGILGYESDLEDKVYPEKVVERRINYLEEKLIEYPGNREIYLGLADLYQQLGNEEKSHEYREKARILDPNNNVSK